MFVAAAQLCAAFVMQADFRRRGLSADAYTVIGLAGLAGLAGARLYHLLESPSDFFADPWPLLFSRTGFAWFGGFLGGFFTLVLLARHYKIPVLAMLDASSPAATLGYGIGRIGCLTSGDGDYGIPTSLPWGMSFPNGLVPTTERVHPTPIYELLAALVIAWFLWRMGEKSLRNSIAAGVIFCQYLILTGIARFLVEFIRLNPRSFFGMSNAQTVAALSVIAGVILWRQIIRRATAVKKRESR